MARDPKTHYERPDSRPLTIPAGFKRPPTLAEQVRRLVRSEQFQMDMARNEIETFEEANDFDIPDDPIDPSTPFEPYFDPSLGLEVTSVDVLQDDARVRAHTEKRSKAARAARERKAAAVGTPPADPTAAGPQEPEKPGS